MLLIYALMFVITVTRKQQKQLAIVSLPANLALAVTPDNQPSHLITLRRQTKAAFYRRR